MRKIFNSILFCLIVCMSISLIGCGNGFAKQEYNDEEKIIKTADHYAKVNSVFNLIEGGYSFTALKFEGRETLWKKTLDGNKELEIQLDLRITNGNAKIVYIDCDDKITVLAECPQNNSNEQSVTKTVLLTIGLNRLKIVGYDCKDVDLKILFDEP